MLGRVFEMFVQGAHERGRGGLGVGLALSKQLIEMHGGRITAASGGPRPGSTFRDPPPDRRGTRGVDPCHRREGRVTGIEVGACWSSTTTAIRSTASARCFASWAIDVHMAFDGVEAVHAAHTYKPDVVLLDVGLPLRNGYEVARLIRGEAWGRNMVLIALTGWGQEQDRKQVTRGRLRSPPGEAGGPESA
jgi:CheY-like chemotaxis protein